MLDPGLRSLSPQRCSKFQRLGLLVAVLFLVPGCSALKFKISDHCDGFHFHNRENVPEPTFWEQVKVGWQLKTKKNTWPDHFDAKPFDVSKEPPMQGFRVLWLGHSSMLIQTPNLNIVTDPILFDWI